MDLTSLVNTVGSPYARLIRRSPVAFVLLSWVYVAAIVFYVAHPKFSEAGRQAEELRGRVVELQKDLKREQTIVDRLTRDGSGFGYLKEISFREQWESEENRAKVERLIDYAKYATKKHDFGYAEELLKEAAAVQGSLSVTLWSARISYAQRDIEAADKKLASISEPHTLAKYPKLLLYRAFLNEEMGRTTDVDTLLQQYMAARQHDPPDAGSGFVPPEK